MTVPQGKHAWTAKVGEKGQIVILKEAREIFGIKPGDTVLLLGDETRGITIVSNDAFIHFADTIFKAQKREQDE
jgi:AbrB family looped-hinge helix DNA binding protein